MGRILLATVLLLSATQSAGAATTTQEPQDLVRVTTDRMLTALSAEREVLTANPDRIYHLVDGIVLPHFDFNRMSRWALGKYWRVATPVQRRRFVTAFTTLLVRTYATARLAYSDEQVVVLPVRESHQVDRATVRTEIRPPGGLPIPINYSMSLRNGQWKVHDVTIDGISLVTNYRSTFGVQIRRLGVEGLIQRLETHKAGTAP